METSLAKITILSGAASFLVRHQTANSRDACRASSRQANCIRLTRKGHSDKARAHEDLSKSSLDDRTDSDNGALPRYRSTTVLWCAYGRLLDLLARCYASRARYHSLDDTKLHQHVLAGPQGNHPRRAGHANPPSRRPHEPRRVSCLGWCHDGGIDHHHPRRDCRIQT